MVRVGLAIAAIVVVVGVFCAIDALMIDRARVRALPRWVWLLVIVLLPALGPLLWLTVGRARIARVAAPDDDPAFLAELSKLLDEEHRKGSEGQQ